jgi:hypothetical protein
MSTAFGNRPWTGNPKFFPPVDRTKKEVVTPRADPDPVPIYPTRQSMADQKAYDRGYRAGYQAASQAMLSEARTDGTGSFVTGEEGSIIAIATQIAKAYGLKSWRDLRQRNRQDARYARQHAMWRCVNETRCSLVKIGRLLGGFDHTTVIHACRAYEERMRKASLTGNAPTV